MTEPARRLENTAPVILPEPIPARTTDLVARGGYRFHVRPAAPADENGLAELFSQLSPEDLRFRFLSTVRIGRHQLEALTMVDHSQTENYLAIDIGTGLIITTALLAANEDLTHAEVAIAIRPAFKGQGISWALLEHVARAATTKGIRTLESVESRDNHRAIGLEREMGWTASPCPDDPTLVVLRTTLPTELRVGA